MPASFDAADPADGRVSLPDPPAVLRQTDWLALEHAAGSADDIPSALLQLTDRDPEVRANALVHLERIHHQNSIYSATTPVALYIAGILSHTRTLPRIAARYPAWRLEQRSLRAVLMDWLGDIADDVSDESLRVTSRGRFPMESTAEVRMLRAARPAIFTAVSQFLHDDDTDVRASAVTAAAQLLDAPGLASYREVLLLQMTDLLVNSCSPYHRMRIERTLQGWNEDPTLPRNLAKNVAEAMAPPAPQRPDENPPF